MFGSSAGRKVGGNFNARFGSHRQVINNGHDWLNKVGASADAKH